MNVEDFERRMLITGGAGFIGSNLLRYLTAKYPDYLFVNLDKLTYAGNLESLEEADKRPNYVFSQGDIADEKHVWKIFGKYKIDGVINLAAESHVDRSIEGPHEFIQTNIIGTFTLLEACRKQMGEITHIRFHHISTDEVYGSLSNGHKFKETSCYMPNSPYSASKASADHFVRAYHKTYGLDTVVSHCSNNYGPYQFPEKLIPLIVHQALNNRIIPVYGDGLHVRDWIHVDDHCRAIDLVFHHGEAGHKYNIGADNEVRNIELIRMICRLIDDLTGKEGHEKLIKYVADRPGHDRRYAIDASKIRTELGWQPQTEFSEGLRSTVKWCLDHIDWISDCINGEHKPFYNRWFKRCLSY